MSSDRKIDKLPSDKKEELWLLNNESDVAESVISCINFTNLDALAPLSSSEKDQVIAQLHHKYLNLQLELHILKETCKMTGQEFDNYKLRVRIMDLEEGYSELQKSFLDMRDVLAKANHTIEIYEEQLKTYSEAKRETKELTDSSKEVSKQPSEDMSSELNNLALSLEETKNENSHLKKQVTYFKDLYENIQKRYDLMKQQVENLTDQLSTELVNKDDVERLKKENEDLNTKLKNAISFNDYDSIPGHAVNVIQKMGKDQKELYAVVDKLKRKYEDLKVKCQTLESENFGLKKKAAVTKFENSSELQEHSSVDRFPLISKSESTISGSNGEDNCRKNEIDCLKQELSEKDTLIEQLNSEIKKRTYNLQELVNKELWNKNREIERLNKLYEECKLELKSLQISGNRKNVLMHDIIIQPVDAGNESLSPHEIKLLKNELRDCVEEKKALLKKVGELQNVLNNNNGGEQVQSRECSLIHNLRLECLKRKEDLEVVEKSRQEAFNACHLLTTRLEELADFLETLLINDFNNGNTVNGAAVASISNKKREVLRQAIERSREISKSFSASFLSNNAGNLIDLSVPILPDCSEINLSFSGGDNDEEEEEEEEEELIDNTLRVSESDDFSKQRVVPRSARFKLKKVDPISRCIQTSLRNNGKEYYLKPNAVMPDILNANHKPLSPPAVRFIDHLNPSSELIFSSAAKQSQSYFNVNNGLADMVSDDKNTIDSLPDINYLTDEKNTVDSFADIDSLPDDKATVGSTIGEIATIDSILDETNTASGNESHYERIHRAGHHLTTASSALVSVEDLHVVCESDSEQWSEPDRNVSAERIGLHDHSVHKIPKRIVKHQQNSFHRSVNSDACSNDQTAEKSYEDRKSCSQFSGNGSKSSSHRTEFCHQLPHYLHQCGQLREPNYLPVDRAIEMKNFYKTDMEHYEVHVKTLRQQLQNTLKYLCKANKGSQDRNSTLIDKFRKILEQFEAMAMCCSKLNNHLHTSTSRCDVLTNMLDETQIQFERVMTDLRSIKLSYNQVILEREQTSTSLQNARSLCDDLKAKLKTEQEQFNRIKLDYDNLVVKYRDSVNELDEIKNNAGKSCRCEILKEQLKMAEDELEKLKRSVPSSQAVTAELTECKHQIEQLLEENQQLTRKLERLELECEQSKKDHENRRIKLEDEIKLKNDINQLLSRENEKYKETREIINKLKQEIRDLNTIIEGDHIVVSEKERTISVLQRTNENLQADFASYKQNAEIGRTEKEIKIRELDEELQSAKAQLGALNEKISLLQTNFVASEAEKCECRNELEKQTKELQNTKVQHEKKMKELLYHIVKHRHEEENNVTVYKQLLAQIEELKMQKNKWKVEVDQWKTLYGTIEKQKRDVLRQLQNVQDGHVNCICDNSQSSFKEDAENELRRNSSKAFHDKTKFSELEKRVEELEMVNKELESRLNQLQVAKVSFSDCEITTSSEESSRPSTPSKQTKSLLSPTSAVPDSPTYNSYLALSSLDSPSTKSLHHERDQMVSQWITPINECIKLHRKSEEGDSIADCVAEPERHLDSNTITAVENFKTSRTNSAVSPDLGIGSEPGRPFNFDDCFNDGINNEMAKLEEENLTLKEQLGSTRKALEDTLQKLTSLNHNKKQMEKAICKQLYKTSNILKKARVNLEEEEKPDTWTTS